MDRRCDNQHAAFDFLNRVNVLLDQCAHESLLEAMRGSNYLYKKITNHHLKGVKGVDTFSCQRYKREETAIILLSGVLLNVYECVYVKLGKKCACYTHVHTCKAACSIGSEPEQRCCWVCVHTQRMV